MKTKKILITLTVLVVAGIAGFYLYKRYRTNHVPDKLKDLTKLNSDKEKEIVLI
jgi:nitrogen regulatory protein PII-like uncharacterized protein